MRTAWTAPHVPLKSGSFEDVGGCGAGCYGILEVAAFVDGEEEVDYLSIA